MIDRLRAAGLRPYVSGRKFGTVGFKVGGRQVEATTFRAAAYAMRRARPDVTFVDDLAEDLAHRDFTINAMAFSGRALVDPFDGCSDLREGIIRTPGNPRDRFREDPVRLIRAARFASQLGFEVEQATHSAMVRCAPHVLDAAVERWTPELDAMLTGRNAAGALRLLAATGILAFILPDVQLQVGYDQNSPYHDRDLFEHTIAVVDATSSNSVNERWAALLHDIGKPYVKRDRPGRSIYVGHEVLGAELVERTALYLKWSKERRVSIRALVASHMDEDSVLKPADDSAKRLPRAEGDRS
jgi:putative nucleotidyltransferase with HDIG domain